MAQAQLSELFEELHRIHRQLADLRDRSAKGPKQVRAAEAAVVKLAQDLDDAKSAYKSAKVASDEKQLSLRQREAKIKDLEAKLNACKTNREFQLLKDQIAADQKANSVLSDEILESFDQLDALKGKIGTSEANLVKGKEESQKVASRVAEQLAVVKTDLERVNAQLADAESRVPESMRLDYGRLAEKMHENALGPLEGDVCGNCSQTVITQTLAEVKMGRFATCKGCGCILYMPSA
jgi:predicted  nucleic acid-binding Zn-ribbon protein